MSFDLSPLTDTALAHKKPVTFQQARQQRDNLPAVAKGLSGAYPIEAGWHPYNKTAVGDSNDGKFYDFAVHGGSGLIETPDFANGYEYAIRIDGFTTGGTNMAIQVYHVATSGWVTITGGVTLTNANGVFAILLPRLLASSHAGVWMVPLGATSALIEGMESVSAGTATVIGKARLNLSGGSSTAGKLYLLRRREYITG